MRPLKHPSLEYKDLPAIPTKKQKLEYRRVHRLRSPLEVPSLGSPAILDDASADQMLNMAISVSLREAGFDLAESLALDSLRDGVEEYMLHFLAYIRVSMASCRRTQPIPQDFEHALAQHSVSLDSLHAHVKRQRKPKQPPTLLPTPPPETIPPIKNYTFMGPELDSTTDVHSYSYIPKHFPKFPGRHTYCETPVYPARETDPKKIRERATEEGRLGENALKKLAPPVQDSHPGAEGRSEMKLWGMQKESMDSMFDKALAEVLRGQVEQKERRKKGKQKSTDTGGSMIDFGIQEPVQETTPVTLGNIELPKFEMGPVVNCEQILQALRESHLLSPKLPLLGIPRLDTALAALRSNEHNPRQPVVEITSPASGDGKTALLYYATAQAVLPAWLENDVVVGGHDAAVIWLDTDARFDAHRLRCVMASIVRQRALQDSDDYTEAVNESLRHVHVFQPLSSPALLATLESIPEYLFRTQHYSRYRPLHAIVIDSASAFSWQDWRKVEVSRIPGAVDEEGHALGATSSRRSTNMPADMVSVLRDLQNKFSCLILYSTAGLYPCGSSLSPLTSFRPYLPYPWITLPALRVVVRRKPVRPFVDGMTVDEARADGLARQVVVQRGVFSGWIDPSSLPTYMQGAAVTQPFSFKISNEGIFFDGMAILPQV
ncbi:hypothetical protein LOZ65_006449 [Ophidiomyces ophidiicola]|nr:hypothetical protein LOZ65_006449 [Ophidiomyces ophidiicola]